MLKLANTSKSLPNQFQIRPKNKTNPHNGEKGGKVGIFFKKMNNGRGNANNRTVRRQRKRRPSEREKKHWKIKKNKTQN